MNHNATSIRLCTRLQNPKICTEEYAHTPKKIAYFLSICESHSKLLSHVCTNQPKKKIQRTHRTQKKWSKNLHIRLKPIKMVTRSARFGILFFFLYTFDSVHKLNEFSNWSFSKYSKQKRMNTMTVSIS